MAQGQDELNSQPAEHDQWQVRMEVCKILQVIGTQESLAELQKALTDENGFVKRAAQNAITAIERRKGRFPGAAPRWLCAGFSSVFTQRGR